MITSASNSRIKQIVQWKEKAKARREDKVFLAEGIKMFLEAPKDWILEAYISEDLHEKMPEGVKDKLGQCTCEVVSRDLFRKISDTQTPQGILCVLKQPAYTLQDLGVEGFKPPLLLVLEDLQDPGNVGTILRTAEGAGVTGIVMSKETADIFNPKTIRATMGSVYRVPFLYTDSLEETIGVLKQHGIRTFAAHLKGKCNYDEVNLTGGTAFLIGNEGNGLKARTADLADTYIRIPMEGQVESLNAAIASAILMYEAHRQRNGR